MGKREFLAICRRLFNRPVYDGCRKAYANGGVPAVKDWIMQTGLFVELPSEIAKVEV